MDELINFLRSRKPANLLLVGCNCAVFLILSFLGDTESGSFLLAHGAMYGPYVTELGEYYRLFTSMFLHFGLQHVVYNMLLLIFMGDVLEREAGSIRYLLIALGGGIAGNFLSLFLEMRNSTAAISAGASGVVFAVIGGLVYLAVRKKGRIQGLSPKRLIFMAVLSIAEGFTVSGVDNTAHIGGFLGGVILAALLLH